MFHSQLQVLVCALLQSPNCSQWSASDNYEAINPESECDRQKERKTMRNCVAADLRKCCHLFLWPLAPVRVLAPVSFKRSASHVCAPVTR